MNDKEFQNLLKEEEKRQKKQTQLIASENFISKDVQKALGSVLSNKYAEGYPGARYYNGNDVIDKIENLARDRALKVFKVSPKNWHVNVQPLSGSPANLAIYHALLKSGDKIMCLKLDHGGHLSHGHKVTLPGKHYTQVPYMVDAITGKLDYDELMKIAKKERPKMIVAGFTAYPRKTDFKKFREITDACGALLHADISHLGGLVAAGVHPSPFKYADTVMTTTHKTLRGPRGAMIFCKTEFADKIDKAVFPGIQGGPHMNQIGALAVALYEASQPQFKEYAKQVVANAHALGNELKKQGFKVVTGGTDTHLLLVDTWNGGAGISGLEASDRLERAGIICNKNTVPYDTRSPKDPSGIRLGTAAETTRGATEEDMIKLAGKIARVLTA